MEKIPEILGHPLVVAAASALLSLILVPLFTNRWQRHQKELDIKTKLVTDMSETMIEPVANSRIWSRGATIGSEMPSYSETLRQIDVRQAKVSTLLQVYFRDHPNLQQEWEMFARALNYCVRVTAADAPDRKVPHLQIVRDYIERSDIEWEALETAQWDVGFGPDFEKAYEKLTTIMLRRGNEIMTKVRKAKFCPDVQ